MRPHPPNQPLAYFPPLPLCSSVIKTPKTLAKPLQQNNSLKKNSAFNKLSLKWPQIPPSNWGCWEAGVWALISTKDCVFWYRRWERETIKKVPELSGLRDQIKKAAPLIQNQMNGSGMFVKQTCHYLSQFEEVSVSSHTCACNRVIYSYPVYSFN